MSGLGDILRFWKNYTDITETDKTFPCSRVDPLGFRFRVTKCFRADGHPWFQLKRGKKKRETFEIFRNDDDDDDDQDKHSSRADNNGLRKRDGGVEGEKKARYEYTNIPLLGCGE